MIWADRNLEHISYNIHRHNDSVQRGLNAQFTSQHHRFLQFHQLKKPA